MKTRDSEETGQRVDGHPGKQLPLESHGRESPRTKIVLKRNVEDRHERTASGAPAEKRGNGGTKSGDRERGGRKLWLIR